MSERATSEIPEVSSDSKSFRSAAGRSALGRVGLWTGTLDPMPVSEVREVAAELDELGYGAVWFGEAVGREAFTHSALLLAATRRMTVAPGIANIYARDATAARAGSRTLAAAYPGRFVLGLGVSHGPLVERRGHEYSSPLAAMREYLAGMVAAESLAPESEDAPCVIAALGPRMLRLAGEAADGAHPYLVTPEHTATARQTLGEGPLLAVEQAAVLTDDREEALRRAHEHLEIYTGLPNYRNSWLRQGFAEEDFIRGGSERLAEALVVWGDAAAIRARVGEHHAAGADHVCVQVLGPQARAAPREDWRGLAPALLE